MLILCNYLLETKIYILMAKRANEEVTNVNAIYIPFLAKVQVHLLILLIN